MVQTFSRERENFKFLLFLRETIFLSLTPYHELALIICISLFLFKCKTCVNDALETVSTNVLMRDLYLNCMVKFFFQSLAKSLHVLPSHMTLIAHSLRNFLLLHPADFTLDL